MNIEKKPVRLSPLHSVVFACIFRDEKRAGVAMLEFLNAILKYVGEELIVEIISMRSEYSLMGERADQKYGRLDVRVRAESGRLFDIEVQIEKEYMNERGFFYGGRMVRDALRAGASYDTLPEVRVINLVDFYVREDHSNVVEPVVLSYAKNPTEVATEKFKMYHIQLPAFRKNHKTLESVKGNLFYTWLYLLDRGYRDEKEMEVLSGMTEGMRNFALQYNYAIDDPDLIRRYRMIEDGKHDVATKIAVATAQAEARGEARGRALGEARGEARGRALGEARGLRNAQIDIARGLKREGVDPAVISRASGLTAAEIEAL